MAHAAFPLPIATPTSLVDARTRRLIRTFAFPVALGIAVATLTATAITHLEHDAARLGAAVSSQESTNSALTDRLSATQRASAVAAQRADSLQQTIAAQLVSLDSREGFLP